MTFTMSIEPLEGSTYQHGFHLGTIEGVARQVVESHWKAGVVERFRSLGLIRGGNLFDVFDGEWANDRADRAFDEMAAEEAKS